MKKAEINKKGPQTIMRELAEQVNNMEDLRAFWERFDNTSLLMVSRVFGDTEPINHLTDVIYQSLKGDEKVDPGAVIRTYSLSWTDPVDALGQMINFRRAVGEDDETINKLREIETYLKKHTCKEVSPGHYSRMDDECHYIDVHKSDIEKAIKELRSRRQPTSAKMIKEFLFDTLPLKLIAKTG